MRFSRTFHRWTGLALALMLGGTVASALPEDKAAETKTEEMMSVPLLPRSCEVDLALSAAPEHLRSGATVYALEKDGYVRVREGDNPFTCIVNRDHPRVLKPTCFDRAGAETIVPKIVYVGKELLAGTPQESLRQSLAEGFEAGRFRSPERPGIAYMLSRYNRPFNAADGTLGWFPPHVMFYAPNLTPEDIGFSMDAWHANQDLPFIGYQGPQGYMIMLADDGQARAREDLPSCPDWVHAENGLAEKPAAHDSRGR
ncbi:MAG: hypothetical protein AAF481_07095 [Acidobacteriota bacterium]